MDKQISAKDTYVRPIDMLEQEMRDRLSAKDAEIARLRQVMGEPTEVMFPVMFDKDLPTLPRSVAWDFVAPHEKRALANHNQTLKRLAERGGLSWTELRNVILDKEWDGRVFINGEPKHLRIHLTAAAYYQVTEKLAAWNTTRAALAPRPDGGCRRPQTTAAQPVERT